MSKLDDLIKDVLEELQNESAQMAIRSIELASSFTPDEVADITGEHWDDIESISLQLFSAARQTDVEVFLGGCQLLFALGYRAAEGESIGDKLLKEALGESDEFQTG